MTLVTISSHHVTVSLLTPCYRQGAALIKQLSNEKHRLQHLVHDKRAQHPEDLVQDVHSHDLYDKISLVEKIVKENDELSREINGKLKRKSEHEKMRENSAEKAAKVNIKFLFLLFLINGTPFYPRSSRLASDSLNLQIF